MNDIFQIDSNAMSCSLRTLSQMPEGIILQTPLIIKFK